jgi:hypothetical protein
MNQALDVFIPAVALGNYSSALPNLAALLKTRTA